jgi:uncharacterized repeat protein (TIGR01451 family)
MPSGELGLRGGVIDTSAGFAYFGTWSDPGKVVKVDLATFTRVGALTLNPGEGYIWSGVIDTSAGFAYFGTNTSPGQVVKVRLSDFTRVGALTLNSGEDALSSAVIDSGAGFAYFGTDTAPGQVVKVRLSDFTRVGALTLNSGENRPRAAVIDPAGGFAYFGTYSTGPDLVVKVCLSDLTRVDALTLPSGETALWPAVIDTSAGFAYFGTETDPGKVVKVRISKGHTTTTISSSPNPSVFGQTVTFTATVTSTSGMMPTGIVFFNDSGVTIGTAALNASGVATMTTFSLVAGEHPLTAVYSGDENHEASSSGIHIHTVNRRGTTTTLSSSASTSVFGQQVTFTATVSSGITFTPTGQVIFRDGGTVIATGTLDGSGRAVFSTADLEVGAHPMRADYQGDQNFLPASASLTQTVNKADTTTSVTSCVPNPSRYGQSVTCTARVTPVAPGAGTPTGQIVFKVDTTPVYTTTLGFGTPGEATYTTSPGDATTLKPVGSHNVTATYGGDNHFTCTTCTSPNYVQTVNRADTEVKLQSSLPSDQEADYGQQLKFTALVSAVQPGAGTVTGTVQFIVNSVVVSSTKLTEDSMSASYVTDTLPIGTNHVAAQYRHDSDPSYTNPNFNDDTSDTIDVKVRKAKSKTSLTSDPNPSNFGQSVTFTAVVTSAGASTAAITPTGTVTFTFPTVGIMTGTLDAEGVATVVTNTLPAGTYNVTADYGGDTNFLSSSATWRHTVNRNATTTTLSASPPGSAAVGQLVTFTAVVSSSAGITPTGQVQFWDGTTVLATQSLNASGVATYTTSSLAPGTHPMKAGYVGTPNFSPSNSPRLFYQITTVGSATSLTGAPNPSSYGQSVTFTATVTRTDTGAPITSGSVTFKDGATTLGSGALNLSGQATFSTSSLTAGTHPITAVFAGNASFGGSTSNVVNQVVNKVTPTVTVTDNPDPTVYGAAVTLVATVAPVAGGATPTGVVSFTVGVTFLGTAPLNASGVATLVTSAIQGGVNQTITATYLGDNNYNPNSNTTTHTVTQASTTTTVTTSPNPSLPGQSVTLTANVTSSAGTVNGGTVQFSVNGSPVGGLVPVSGGVATYNHTFASAGTYNVTAAYSGNSNFQASNNNASPRVHTVAENPTDLAVTKTDSPDPVPAGNDVTYVIVVTNNGSYSTDVTLTDTLPPEVTLVSATPSQGSCSGTTTITCNLGTLAGGGGSATVTIVVHVPLTTPAGTILRNTAQVSGTRPDSDLSNNTAIQETTVYRSPRFGDCNGDDAVDVGDVLSIVRRIFDPAYQGTTACDANRDNKVDAGDVPCTVLIMFDGPGACRTSESQSLIPNTQSGAVAGLLTVPPHAAASVGPALTMPDQVSVVPGGRATVPVTFTANGHSITSLAFSVDYDQSRFAFDPTDRDGNGIPDALVLVLPGDFTARVTFDRNDADGELDVFIGDITPPLTSLSDGTIGVILLDVVGPAGMVQEGVRFSLDPAASFGNTLGQSVPGTATPVGRYRIYLPVLIRQHDLR